jgi:phage tail sheath protein FI
VYDIKELPAGYEYGELPILDIDVDVDTSSAIKFSDAHINTVVRKPKAGYVMWNAKTLLKKDSPLNRTAPVRILLSTMKDIGDSLDSQAFRINNTENRAKIERMGNNYLSTLISLGRITGGRIFCDEDNNGPEVRKQKKMYVDMGITFPGYSEFIYFTAIIGDDGVTLSDLRIQR